jgi:hypothetical protein
MFLLFIEAICQLFCAYVIAIRSATAEEEKQSHLKLDCFGLCPRNDDVAFNVAITLCFYWFGSRLREREVLICQLKYDGPL